MAKKRKRNHKKYNLQKYLEEQYVVERTLALSTEYQMKRTITIFSNFLERPSFLSYLNDRAVSKFINNKLAKNPHVNPVAIEAFGGRYSNFDYTDPEKVKAWAIELGKKLRA